MKVDVVVDVGNTRMKWGRVADDHVAALAALPAEETSTWGRQIASWNLTPGASWLLSGVHPQRRDTLAEWLRQAGHQVRVLTTASELPLRVKLEFPDRAGIDRLLNAVAANARRRGQQPAILIDVGSAVTVDLVDVEGSYRGGAIFPGLRLMFKALHDYTALLPVVEAGSNLPAFPGTSTSTAIQAGVVAAIAGGIEELIARQRENTGEILAIFLTGGDAAFLAPALRSSAQLWPEMTLEGLRLTANRLE